MTASSIALRMTDCNYISDKLNQAYVEKFSYAGDHGENVRLPLGADALHVARAIESKIGAQFFHLATLIPEQSEWGEARNIFQYKHIAPDIVKTTKYKLLAHPKNLTDPIGSIVFGIPKLSMTACPTGAIRDSDAFGFVSCLTHNYRERLGGFIDWSERIADSNAISDREAISMWQSLFCGAGTKCDYCMAVCPAGASNAAEYTVNKQEYFAMVVKPLVEREVEVFVVPGSDADFYIKQKAPNTKIRYASNGLRPASASDFLRSLPHVFQREPAVGVSARYHFTFTGCEHLKATVCIKNQTLQVLDGHTGNANCSVIADSDTWVKVLAKRESLFVALLLRKIRVSGITHLNAFKRCFPDGG